MKISIFGLALSSSWGNGHATIWRGLIRVLTQMGHEVAFFERDVPYYASNRDFNGFFGLTLHLYKSWQEIFDTARRAIRLSDVAIVTSYYPDAVAVSELIENCGTYSVYYDLDTPVTLKNIESGIWPGYIGKDLTKYDCVLSFTGGRAIEKLKTVLGAKEVFPLYGCADSVLYGPVKSSAEYKSDLSYLGTYAEDRQKKLQELLLKPAGFLKNRTFLISGAQYPCGFPWDHNVLYREHIAPPDHSCFYCSSSFTLNITRSAMAEMGYCPSGRLFEAALCGAPVISDNWEGMELFFNPGEEICLVQTAEDVIRALSMDEKKRMRMGYAALWRAVNFHTSEKRAHELIAILEGGKG